MKYIINVFVTILRVKAMENRRNKVYGICMTYNAGDIVAPLIDSVVTENFDGLVILDNFSSDGTMDILEKKVHELKDSPFDLCVLYDKCRAFFKAKKMNSLAAFANYRAWHTTSRFVGRTWIVPMDQDEIWTTSNNHKLGDWLSLHLGVVGFWNYMRNYIPTIEDDLKELNPLKRIKYYLPAKDYRQQIKNEKACYIYDPEIYSPSGHHHVIIRSLGQVRVPRATEWLVIKHYPYRSYSQVKEKYTQLYYAIHLQGEGRIADQDRHVDERGSYNETQFKTFWENECISKDPIKEGLLLDKEV